MSGADGPVLHLTLLGNFANQMIGYMVALKLVSLVPGCRISNVNMPALEHRASGHRVRGSDGAHRTMGAH